MADDDANVCHPGVADRFDDPDEHRLVGDRNQLFGTGVGQWIEARALATAQNQSLHKPDSLRDSARPGPQDEGEHNENDEQDKQQPRPAETACQGG